MKCIPVEIYQNWSVLVLCTSISTTLSTKTTTWSSGPRVGNFPPKTQHPWHHLVDKKHYSLHVKFEMRFIISFTGKYMSNKKVTHFMGGWPALFKERCLKRLGIILVWDARCLCGWSSKGEVTKSVEKWVSFIHALDTEWNHYCTQNPSQARAKVAESRFLYSSSAPGIKTVVMEMVSGRFYWLKGKYRTLND
jgi:hypothetical protein